MERERLPLLINSLKLLLEALDPGDTVAIVTYAGSAGVVLEPTRVTERSRILASLEHLSAGGSTAGAEGIRQAYLLAERSFVADGVNRVILATDGDFNVGITNPGELESYVERKRAAGVFLSVLGFGRGNYNDALMQTLAHNGNGNAAYIDSLSEARKVLVEEATSTLFPIAEDVKIQVEFNPAVVSEYRLDAGDRGARGGDVRAVGVAGTGVEGDRRGARRDPGVAVATAGAGVPDHLLRRDPSEDPRRGRGAEQGGASGDQGEL